MAAEVESSCSVAVSPECPPLAYWRLVIVRQNVVAVPGSPQFMTGRRRAAIGR